MAFAGALICRMRSGGIPDEGEDPGRQPHEGQTAPVLPELHKVCLTPYVPWSSLGRTGQSTSACPWPCCFCEHAWNCLFSRLFIWRAALPAIVSRDDGTWHCPKSTVSMKDD